MHNTSNVVMLGYAHQLLALEFAQLLPQGSLEHIVDFVRRRKKDFLSKALKDCYHNVDQH